jgi:MSHA biogenesis protein MshQ
MNFGYECNDPTSCATGNLLAVNGTLVQSNNNVPLLGYSYTGISLTFDSSGNSKSSISFSYEDVGQITLRMQNTTNGANLLGNNAFVVTPDHFTVDVCNASTANVNGDCAAGTTAATSVSAVLAVAGTASTQSGAGFKASVRALSANNNVLPSYGAAGATTNNTESVTLAATCTAPYIGTATSCPAAGTLNGAKSILRSAFNNNNYVGTESDLAWSEVGLITLTATTTNSTFMGVTSTATGTSLNAGRFRPDHFDTVATGPMTCPAGVCALPITTMVYSGQPFASAQVTAMNAASTPASPQITVNYQGSFAKPVTLSAVASSGGAAVATGTLTTQTSSSGLANLFGTNGSCTGGAGACETGAGVAPYFTLGNVTAPLVPAPLDVYLHATDGETVSGVAGSTEGGVKVVSGRVKISNAYGSELLPLSIVAAVQFYNGNNWVASSTDSSTTLALATATTTTYPVMLKGLQTGTTTPSPTGLQTVTGGLLNIKLSKPTGGSGSVTVNPGVPSYLLLTPGYETFGIYKGNNSIIYMRENF